MARASIFARIIALAMPASVLGYIKDQTGSFPMALIPLATLTMIGSITTLLIGRVQRQR